MPFLQYPWALSMTTPPERLPLASEERPTPPPVIITERAASLAVTHIGVTSALLGVAVILLLLRIWVRMRPSWRITWEDYLMFIGTLFAIVDFGFLLPQMITTPGSITMDAQLTGRKYAFLAIPIWGIAMTFIKTSIALMLLRIQPTNLWWKVFCFSIITLQTLYGVANTFFILLQCRPLEASWNRAILSLGGECLPPIGIHIMSNLGSAINISTDILLSLAPTLFLWKLKRPLREKLLVGFLMGLGAFASVASIIKTMLVTEFGKAEDAWALTNAIATWTALEQLLAMIAASAPYLKPMLQSALQHFGVTLTEPSNYASGYHRATGRSTFHGGTMNRADGNGTGNQTSGNGGVKVTRKVSMVIGSKAMEGDESPFANGSLAGNSEDGIPLETRYGANSGKSETKVSAGRKSWQSGSDHHSWAQVQEAAGQSPPGTQPTHAV